MTFSEFLNAAWTDHATDAAAVAARLPQGLNLVGSAGDIPALVNLAVHVMGEHLGKWQEGAELLDQIGASKFSQPETESMRAVLRGKAILALCSGDEKNAEKYAAAAHSGPAPLNSTKARIQASAAAAFAGQKQITAAQKHLDQALDLASYGPSKDDPAARALAVTGNNLAMSLEEQLTRSGAETELMKRAARIARKYWETAGGWIEIERAEYRLAMTMLAAGEPLAGLEHADACLTICKENKAEVMEVFFANEARAKCLWSAKRQAEAENVYHDASQIVESLRQSVDYMTAQLAALKNSFK